MPRERRRPKWRVHFSASDEDVRFSLQGNLGRRAGVALLIIAALIACALLAPDIAAEVARLLKVFTP